MQLGGKFPPTYLGGVQTHSPRFSSDPTSAGVLGEVQVSWPASPPNVSTPYAAARWNKTGWDSAISLPAVVDFGEGVHVNALFRTGNLTEPSHFARAYNNGTALLSVSIGRLANGSAYVGAEVLASGTLYICNAEVNETALAKDWTSLTASCVPAPACMRLAWASNYTCAGSRQLRPHLGGPAS